ncbi:hypothetical protein V7N88_003463 [Vibrio cholerae]|nr:hypothetical protein [Vibrio cholerae]RBM38143.1 hypothetical protein DLR66_18120 [Vibrio paracholerae]MCX9582828.1 hypothetical protein [Vibrio cholerae]MCX9586280.1 hypothetical protein [Vibrio cholerae]MDA5312388.1 hypothetical protein [Vibrio cholerae]
MALDVCLCNAFA